MTDQALLIDVPPYAGNTDEDTRYTLDEADHWLREKAGVTEWDLDAAACHESHRAERYYTLERGENGLALPWARRTFLNPPWSLIDPWVERARLQMLDTYSGVDHVGFILPLRTHRPWWQLHIEPYFAMPVEMAAKYCGYSVRIHHPPTRFKYGHPGNPRGIGVAEPNFQSVGVVFRRL